MGMIRTLGATTVSFAITPAVLASPNYWGTVLTSSSFSITNNIATVVFSSSLPANGFNPPNPALTPNLTPPNGQQVVLWGFTTATYFNGKKVTIIAVTANSISFAFTHANVSSTSDTTGQAASIPVQRYRAIRLECSQTIGTDLIYVGDLNVSSSRYMSALSLAGQLAIEVVSENVAPEDLMLASTSSSDSVQVTVIY